MLHTLCLKVLDTRRHCTAAGSHRRVEVSCLDSWQVPATLSASFTDVLTGTDKEMANGDPTETLILITCPAEFVDIYSHDCTCSALPSPSSPRRLLTTLQRANPLRNFIPAS